MNNAVAKIEKNGFLYQVYNDEMPITARDFAFGDEAANDELFRRFVEGELDSYIITKSKLWEGCEQFKEIYLIGGFWATSPDEAIEQYLGDYDTQ